MQGRWTMLSLALLTCLGVSARQREGTEWSTSYWYNANEHRLPRILLLGDSICNGYQSMVKDKLAGVAYTSFWATSKCVTDPTYLKLLSFILGEYDYEVIHFNNGLHSLNTDRTEWEAGLRAAFDLLKAEGRGAKIVWATSTPLKDPELTAKAKELNAIAAKVVAEYGFPTDDLFALMDPQDRDKLWSDTFHYHAEGRDMQATQVAETIKPLLAGWQPPAGMDSGIVKNADFEGEGEWRVYPFDKPEVGSWEAVADNPHGGAKCAKITVKQAGVQFFQYKPALQAGKTYTLRWWARAEAPSRLQVHLRTQKPPYVFFGDKTVDLTTEWTQYSTELVLPEDFQSDLHVLFLNLPAAGTYWIDDVTVEAK